MSAYLGPGTTCRCGWRYSPPAGSRFTEVAAADIDLLTLSGVDAGALPDAL